MRKLIKYIPIVALVLFALYHFYSVHNLNATISDYKKIAPVKDSLLQQEKKRFQDELGNQYAKYSLLELELQDFKQMHSAEVNELKRKMKEAGIKAKELDRAVVFSPSTSDKLVIPVHDTLYLDSTKEQSLFKSFAYADSFMSMQGGLHLRTFKTAVGFDSISIDYSLKQTYSLIHSYEKDGLFKPRMLNLTIVADNPKTTIGRVQTYTIAPRKRRFYEKKGVIYLFGAVTGGFLAYKILL